MRAVYAFLLAAVLIAGCTQQPTTTTTTLATTPAPDQTTTTAASATGTTSVETLGGVTTVAYSGQKLAGSSAPLIDFNKADYVNAIATDKLIVLYFYADWCPICKAEVPKLYDAFNELTTDKVIGFRVNYNDGSTDDDERALAEQFGVGYQHGKVFVRNGERVLKSPESWDKDRYLREIAAQLG